jgi:hypothetical protein
MEQEHIILDGPALEGKLHLFPLWSRSPPFLGYGLPLLGDHDARDGRIRHMRPGGSQCPCCIHSLAGVSGLHEEGHSFGENACLPCAVLMRV